MNSKSSEVTKKAIAYYRVSTERQGESGLGLEAQQQSVANHIQSRNVNLVKEFIEIESGKTCKRPVLKSALEYCKANKALLLIAKLDRLGRNVVFISSLMESNVEFIAVDNPHANNLILHILAAFAQHEREQISERTKLALQAAKKRGVKLGTHGHLLAMENKAKADHFAKKMKPMILQLKKKGFKTIDALAIELNRKKIPTYRKNAKWHKSTVHSLLCRISSIS
ncbi:MAG: recombinase family protein [Williamsia sp.]|nr:recombinase family protein [Williamsia sp.]